MTEAHDRRERETPGRRSPGRFALGALVALAALAGLLAFAAGQPATLRWIAAQAQRLFGDRLAIDGIDGSLLGPATVRSLRWKSDGIAIAVDRARLAWQPSVLLEGRARIDVIEADRIAIDLPESAPERPTKPTPIRLPDEIALPLPVTVGRVAVGDVMIRRGATEIARLTGVESGLRIDDERIELAGLAARVAIRGTVVDVQGEASMRPADPFHTEVRLQARLPLQPQPLRIDLRADGPLAELDLRLNTQWSGARLTARTTARVLDPRPLRQVKVDLGELDLARIGAGLPQTDIRAELVADLFPAWAGPQRRPLFAGPLKVVNALPGALDSHRLPIAVVTADTRLVDDRIDLRSLRIAGPPGEVVGDGWWSPNGFGLEAKSEAVRVEAILRALRPRKVTVEFEAKSDRPIGDRAIDLDFRASDADAALAGAGSLRGDWLTIARADLALAPRAVIAAPPAPAVAARKRGRAAATPSATSAGRAALEGRVRVVPPFDVDVRGRVGGFEPHRLLQMPEIRLEGTFAGTGQLGTAATGGRLRGELVLADSRLRGLPLSGRVVAAVHLRALEPIAVDQVDVGLQWGATRVSARGALGDGAGALDIDLATRTLGQLVDGASGQGSARARLRGPLTAPAIETIDLKGDNVAMTVGDRRISADSIRAGARGLRLDRSATIEANAALRSLRLAPAGARSAQPVPIDLASASARIDGTLASHRVDVDGRGLNQRLRLVVAGAASQPGAQRARVARGGGPSAPVTATPAWDWAGRVEQFELQHRQLAMPRLRTEQTTDPGLVRATAPFDISASFRSAPTAGGAPSSLTVAVEAARFAMQGAQIDLERLEWRQGRIAARLAATGLPAHWVTRFVAIDALYLEDERRQRAATPSRPPRAPPSPALAPVEPLRLSARATFEASTDDLTAADWIGRLEVRRQRGDVYLATPSAPGGRISAGLTTLDIDARLDRQQARVRVAIEGENVGTVDGQAETTLAAAAPPFWSEDSLARSPLGGRIGFSMRSLRWVSPLVGDSWRVDGALAANLTLGGQLSAPRIEGVVTGSNLSADEQQMGMRLHDGVMVAEFSGDRVDVKLLRFASGDGSVAMAGLLRVPGRGGTSQARVDIDRLPIPMGVGQRIVVSGNAGAELTGRNVNISGRLEADEGVIELRSNDAPSLGADVVIVARDGRRMDRGGDGRRMDRGGATSAGPSPGDGRRSRGFTVSSAMEIDLGHQFRVFGSGVNARLTGAIRLGGALPDKPRADGLVKIEDGTYQIYGRKLDITSGELRFNGPLDDPLVSIVAIRPYLKVEAGVEISGNASNPMVKLISNPEVSDAEKLSWLVLGTGLDDAEGAGQLLVLQAAADSLLGDENSKYADSLTDRIGIDMLSVKEESKTGTGNASGQAAAPGTVVTVGKRLSRGLFVTYEQSLRGVWNILKLQYDITNRFSLSVQAGSDSGIDLLWYLPFD